MSRPAVIEDSTLYWLMLVIGVVPVAAALVRHSVFGVQETLGGLLAVFALRGLVVLALLRFSESRRRKRTRFIRSS